MRERSREMSEMRSVLTGQIVDSYTNILTVKLFARASEEDAFVREAVDEHSEAWRAHRRIGTLWGLSLQVMNALLMVGTGVLAIVLWRSGHIAVGTVATAIPMAWQLNNMSGTIAQQIANIFDDLGQVQDGMRSIAVERQMPDLPGSVELPRITGGIRFERVSFDYGRMPRRGGVLRELQLNIAPGQRARIHRGARGLARAHRVRCACRRARRQIVGRPAAAHRARPGDPEERADPGPRRGDIGARFRGRGGDPGTARRIDGRAHGHRHRASAVDNLPHGPARRARPRPHRRGGDTRGPARGTRPLRGIVAPAVGRLPHGSAQRRAGGRSARRQSLACSANRSSSWAPAISPGWCAARGFPRPISRRGCATASVLPTATS